MSAAPAPITSPGWRTANRMTCLSTRGARARSLRHLVPDPDARLELLGEQYLGAAHHDRVARSRSATYGHEPATRDRTRLGNPDPLEASRPAAPERPEQSVPLHDGGLRHVRAAFARAGHGSCR